MKTPEDEKIDQRITRAINEYGLLDKIRECDYSYEHLFNVLRSIYLENVLRSIYLEGAFDQIEASQSKPQEIPEENRQKLFNHMSTEHGLTLLESEMNSIYSICIGHEEYVKYLNWLHSKPQEIEFVKSKDQDGDDLISWKTLSGLYNIIIHNESIGVSFIPFDSNQKSQLIHHDFTRNTKTVDAVEFAEWLKVNNHELKLDSGYRSDEHNAKLLNLYKQDIESKK